MTDDDEGGLTIRQMDRKEALDLLARIKKRALEEAEKASAELWRREVEERRRLHEERQEKRRLEIERRALLQKQRERLLEQEGEPS